MPHGLYEQRGLVHGRVHMAIEFWEMCKLTALSLPNTAPIVHRLKESP